MSEKPWTERTGTGLMAGLRKPQPQPAHDAPMHGPELVKSDQPETDPFADTPDYEAVRSILGRSMDACFYADDGMPHLKPWAYFQGADAHPENRGITLHWPGARIEVTGENIGALMLRIMTRRADIWRSFDKNRHRQPPPGATVIRSIRVVVEGE